MYEELSIFAVTVAAATACSHTFFFSVFFFVVFIARIELCVPFGVPNKLGLVHMHFAMFPPLFSSTHKNLF